MKRLRFLILTLLVFGVVSLTLGACTLIDRQAPTPTDDQIPTAIEPNTVPSTAPVTLQIDLGNDKIIANYSLTAGKEELLWPVMKKILDDRQIYLKSQSYGGLGVLVTQIGDYPNGQDGKFWQYFINGNYAPVGASSYRLKAGDLIEWQFASDVLKR